MPLSIIILAAGQGTRMKSSRPKVLHHLAGKPLLQHVVDASHRLNPDQIIVVIGHHADQVREQMVGQKLDFIIQHEQQGTGHAVAQCFGVLNQGNDILVLYGDVPMISPMTLEVMLKDTSDDAINILSFIAENPTGYGRIVRHENDNVIAIVEEKDASQEQKGIQESNSGIMYISGNHARNLVERLDNNNTQEEFYLTDVVKHAVDSGLKVSATICEDTEEVLGVNNQTQLAKVESLFRQKQAIKLMDAGVKLYDPNRIDIRGCLQVGSDVEIDINCVFIGDVVLGDHVKIAANCIIENSTIGSFSQIFPMTSIDTAFIGEKVSIGPFARVRPGTQCADGAKIGNFVETKKAQIGEGSKINHLSYVGDAEVGKGVNIGAGTITCNYDGVNKFKTIIEDDVFVGSGTQLVAPVKLARGATVGAGSTITRDTPADQLTLTRAKQLTVAKWSKPVRKKQE
ncbi:MAG: bifunctional UDP-N-acetylglucosamine diphosphorylase/glucosamine-1-phosphate N-acetyltransferase GlmU [Gammaproteobacteria bacterium]|nr:bifunctional UDP-N-acetylglucosamine diphosphorylase/glucosamine-1-phosphate N-acetyltransferase GlmU [Gammaproteobacteria bacterium]